MKRRLSAAADLVDALDVRARAALFGAGVAVIVVGCGVALLLPLARQHAGLREQLRAQHQQVAAIEDDVTQRVLVHAQDPDAAAVARLAAVRQDSARLAARLRSMRSSLVAPESMAPLLAALLKVNGKLKLEELVTLPASAAELAGAAPSRAATPLFYRHGVRLSVSGSYGDMVAYMDALEAMPTQLFWGEARFDVGAWPEARLRLTMYTLSLDATWISL